MTETTHLTMGLTMGLTWPDPDYGWGQCIADLGEYGPALGNTVKFEGLRGVDGLLGFCPACNATYAAPNWGSTTATMISRPEDSEDPEE